MRALRDPLMSAGPPTRSNHSDGREAAEGDLPLFAPRAAAPEPPTHPDRYADTDESIDARFARFHAGHPEVFDRFAEYALRALLSGRKVGAKAIWERLRWELEVERDAAGSEPYKLNNDYTSRYARMLADRDPRFAEFFEFRTLKSLTA